jgi:hypothetical protein
MKTIKKAAEEYVGKDIGTILLGYTPVERAKYDAFKSGVEFAQRWISVDEELPPCSDIDILIKGINYEGQEGIVDIGYMHESVPCIENFISLSGEIYEVTHWRPIELK